MSLPGDLGEVGDVNLCSCRRIGVVRRDKREGLSGDVVIGDSMKVVFSSPGLSAVSTSIPGRSAGSGVLRRCSRGVFITQGYERAGPLLLVVAGDDG